MSLAENLLNSLPTENISEDYSTNEEEHIIVDNTRKITVPAKLKTIAVTGDKDIETVMIDCVRYWDGHDLSEFAVYINYVLPNGETGTYVPYGVSRTDEYFTLEWIIGSEFTKHSGTLRFLIMAKKTNAEGYLVYQWSSLLNSDMTIQQGLEPSEMSEEELESDVVTQILQSLNTKLSYSNIASSTGDNEYLVMSQKATTAELRNRANALIGTVSDTAISLDDVSPVKHKINANLRSKNLISYPYKETTKTKNGITFTDNGDGSITINGQKIEDEITQFELSSRLILPVGSYIFSGGNADTLDYIAKLFHNQNGWQKNWTYGKVEITNDIYGNGYYISIVINIRTGVNYSNVTVYPQLEYGTVATPYTPYVADDTPITVKSCGKNLIRYPYSETTKTVNGITFTDNGDGSVSVKGTASKEAGFNLYYNLIESLVPQGNTIVVSGGVGSLATSDVVYIFVAKIKADGTTVNYLNSPTGTLTGRIEEGEKLVKVNIWVSAGMTVDCTIYPQLEVGTTATPYEPYKEGETIETTIADGAQLESIAPNMTITTDTDDVVIDTEYNKDSNIVIEKLTQAIIALGGNV